MQAPQRILELGHGVWRADLPPEQCGLKIVGVPVGTDAYVAAIASANLHEEESLLKAISELKNVQAAWLLFYFCAVSRVNHRLRTVPPSQLRPHARNRDDRMLEMLRFLLGKPVGASAEPLASVPA